MIYIQYKCIHERISIEVLHKLFRKDAYVIFEHTPTDKTDALFSDKTYILEDQIMHKLALLDKLIPTTAKLTLIGHSIGCKVITEIFKRNTTHRIQGKKSE